MMKDLATPSLCAQLALPLSRLRFVLFAMDPDRTTAPTYNYGGWTTSYFSAIAFLLSVVAGVLGVLYEYGLYEKV